MPRLLRVGLLIHVLTEALFLNLAEVELTFARCRPWLCGLMILHFPSVLFGALFLLEFGLGFVLCLVLFVRVLVWP